MLAQLLRAQERIHLGRVPAEPIRGGHLHGRRLPTPAVEGAAPQAARWLDEAAALTRDVAAMHGGLATLLGSRVEPGVENDGDVVMVSGRKKRKVMVGGRPWRLNMREAWTGGGEAEEPGVDGANPGVVARAA